MRRALYWILSCSLLVLLVVFPGCNTTLLTLDVPPAVWAGHDFLIAVQATGTVSGLYNGTVGCVLQLPNGFPVVSHALGVRDDPALLSMYTAEPGHYLVSFSGVSDQMTGWTHCVVSAPTSVGTHQIKVAMAGFAGGTTWQATDPAGVTNFAVIGNPRCRKNVTVVPDPPFDYALEGTGIAPEWSRLLFAFDVDRDGRDDLGTSSGVYSWRAGGSWHRVSSVTGQTAGEFDGDGITDFVYVGGLVTFGDGQGGGTSTRIFFGNTTPDASVAVGDLDGDGRDEVVFVEAVPMMGTHFMEAKVFRCLPGRTFTSQQLLLCWNLVTPTTCRVAEVTGDSLPDIVTNAGTLIQNAAGTWTTIPPPGYNHAPFAVGDLTGDGVAEIVLLSTSIAVWSYTGTQWTSVTVAGLPATHSFVGVQVVDYDRDGLNDLVFAGPGIAVYRNIGAATFQFQAAGLPAFLADHVASPGVGAAASLVVGDFQGDGLPDIAVAALDPTYWYQMGHQRVPLVFTNMITGVHAFGAGCAAPGLPAPVLDGIGRPLTGNATFALRLQHGAASGLGLFWFGTSKRYLNGQPILPLSLAAYGAPGCELLADALQWHVSTLDPTGTAALPVPIPNLPSLRFVSCFAQAAAFQPGANPLGLLTTHGLVVRIE